VLFLLSAYGCCSSVVVALIRRKARWNGWLFVLLCGYAFYAAIDPAGFLWLIGATLVSYAAALMQGDPRSARSRFAFVVGILAIVLPLFGMKAWSLAHGSALGSVVPGFIGTLLPLGTSFYSLQALSYLIDVRRGTIAAETNFKQYALYLGFFLQLFAGPVERARATLGQFAKRQVLLSGTVLLAVELILWGLFKKLVLADRIAFLLDSFWTGSQVTSVAPTLFYSFLSYIRIYADYSGYMDIACGGALFLGIQLSPSFLQPYCSTSVREFWRRWNITISSWFRDYIYIPLGGSRTGTGRWMLAILVTFFLSGFWHGSGWQFLIWGTLHGAWLILEAGVIAGFRRLIRTPLPSILERFIRVFGWMSTVVFVSVTFLLFQAPNLSSAFALLSRIHSLGWRQLSNIITYRSVDLSLIAIATILMIASEIRHPLHCAPATIGRSLFFRLLWLGIVLLLILNIGIFSERPFVYFAF
jgi:D-alanyl-lipoteichoic acid acyltransferase DltB (MBOAT superfamily)